MIPRVQASINLKALQHNFSIAKRLSGYQNILAVVKANAYGHGLLPVAEALYGQAGAFGVSDINEALQLKQAGCDYPILIMQGIIHPQDVSAIASNGFQLVVHSEDHLAILENEFGRLSNHAPLVIWLKINTGMGRLGISPEKAAEIYTILKTKSWVGDIILMTHLANASMPDSALNKTQLSRFENLHIQLDSGIATSIPNSAAMLSELHTECDWARPGLMLYGSSPFDWLEQQRRRDALGLQAVMTLESKLISIQQLHGGDNVGYCSQFICPEDMQVGIVSIGYADGYPSNAPNGTPVLVNNQRTQTVGRVSMDMLAVDLRQIRNPNVGDPVTLWGEKLSIDEVADVTGIISYKLSSSVSPRVHKRYG